MRLRSRLALVMAMGLLMGLVALPAVAGGPHDKATGTVEWTARGGALPGLTTSFSVHDLHEGGMDDRGFWTLSRAEGSYTAEIVCVNVVGDEAWFAGIVTESDGIYETRVDAVQLFWVHDVATPGSGGDLIGGAGPDRFGSIANACSKVEAMGWRGTGAVDAGNLKTHTYDN